MSMSLVTANTAGATKRSTTNALFFVSYCVGNIIGPFAFKKSEAPHYRSGITAILVAYCVLMLILVVLGGYLAFLNRLKEEALQEKGLTTSGEEEKALSGFQDLTDKENMYFRYTY